MKIKITTDSTCDLSNELLEKYNIAMLPLTIVKNGEAFKESAPCQQPSLYQIVGSISPLFLTGRPSSGRFFLTPLA